MELFSTTSTAARQKARKAEAVGLVYLESKVRRLCLVTRKI